MRRHLAGQANDRNGIHQRVSEAGNRIGGARARGDQHNANLSGRARITFGGMNSPLLVAHQNVTQLVLLKDLVVNRKDSTAWIAEDDLNTLIDQGTNNYARTGHGSFCRHRSYSISLRAAQSPPGP